MKYAIYYITLILGLLNMAESTSAESFGDDPWYKFGGLQNGCNGKGTISDAITLPDGRVVVIGSGIDLCGDTKNNGMAVYDPRSNEWQAFPGFIRGASSKLEYSNSRIFIIDGSISPSLRAEGVDGAHRFLIYNMIDNTWIAPADMIDDTINCIAIDKNEIYLGGAFDVIDGTVMNNVALYLLNEDTWIPLGSGTNSRVDACDINPNYFYIGGIFSTVNGINVNKSAAYNRNSSQWQSMGAGFTDPNAIIRDIVGIPTAVPQTFMQTP